MVYCFYKNTGALLYKISINCELVSPYFVHLGSGIFLLCDKLNVLLFQPDSIKNQAAFFINKIPASDWNAWGVSIEPVLWLQYLQEKYIPRDFDNPTALVFRLALSVFSSNLPDFFTYMKQCPTNLVPDNIRDILKTKDSEVYSKDTAQSLYFAFSKLNLSVWPLTFRLYTVFVEKFRRNALFDAEYTSAPFLMQLSRAFVMKSQGNWLPLSVNSDTSQALQHAVFH